MLIFTQDFIVKHLGKTEGLKSLQLFNELLESPKIQLSKPLFIEIETILQQIKNETEIKKDTYSSSIKRGLLHVLVSKLYREKTRGKEAFKNTKYLNQLINFQSLVEEQWSDSKTALNYAKQMAVTPKTLNSIVKSVLNKSAKSLIDDIVITQIKRLLINTELSITEIAYKSGFDDPTNFFKYFKKNTTFSPKQFQDIHK